MSVTWPRSTSCAPPVRWVPVPVTASAVVVPLVDAKLHARLPADSTIEDGLVAKWTAAAQQQVEMDTDLKLLTQTYDLVGDAFPAGRRPIVLPFGPLQSVTSITAYDSAAPSVLQTMDAATYVLDVTSSRGRIGLAAAAEWPTNLREFQPVSLRVIVGYDAIAKIPEPLLQAVRLAIGWHAMHREPTVLEAQSYNWLIDPYRPVVVA